MLFVDPKTLAEAYKTASRVTNLALGCIVPPGLGFLLDKKFGTLPVLSIVGSIFGLISLFVQLRQLIREMPQGPTRKK